MPDNRRAADPHPIQRLTGTEIQQFFSLFVATVAKGNLWESDIGWRKMGTVIGLARTAKRRFELKELVTR